MVKCLECEFTVVGEIQKCFWCKTPYCEDCISAECVVRNGVCICKDCNEVELGAKFDEILLVKI
ncbi:MAG: hypothetical protein R2685_10630 [Candidatus Nitrosocosmicus sp.]|nr:hypothetical protein [Candidatus Nitrosocosmicus sp.]